MFNEVAQIKKNHKQNFPQFYTLIQKSFHTWFCIIKAIDWVFHTGWDCHIWSNFKPGNTWWTTMIFGTLKDSSLKLNNSPLINYFRDRNFLQNSAKALSKMVLKNIIILYFWTIWFGLHFASMWLQYVSNNVCRDFSLSASAFATVALRSSKCKFTEKSFSDRTFYVTITDADIESLKSLRTLFNKYLDHMLMKFEQNRMVKNIQNFEFFGKNWLTIFLERVDAILEDVAVP